jgi:Transcriptional Coactivator p15 (PC4)
MPSAARQRWLGKGDHLNMRKIVEQAHQRNRELSPGADTTQVWSAEFQINTCESLRAELRRHKTRVTLDLRRWFKPPDGAAQPTGRGLAISVKHIYRPSQN